MNIFPNIFEGKLKEVPKLFLHHPVQILIRSAHATPLDRIFSPNELICRCVKQTLSLGHIDLLHHKHYFSVSQRDIVNIYIA